MFVLRFVADPYHDLKIQPTNSILTINVKFKIVRKVIGRIISNKFFRAFFRAQPRNVFYTVPIEFLHFSLVIIGSIGKKSRRKVDDGNRGRAVIKLLLITLFFCHSHELHRQFNLIFFVQFLRRTCAQIDFFFYRSL